MPDTRKHFDESLNLIKNMMIKLFNDTIMIYENMFISIKQNDTQLAARIIDGDHLINTQEHAINRETFLTILKQSPVAKDLRRLMIAIKIASDLERIADYAVNICTYLLNTKHDNLSIRNHLMQYEPPLIAMFKKILQAYELDSLDLSYLVCEDDNLIDLIYQKHIKHLINVIKTSTSISAEEAARAILVIKQFERAGDHITNIAEQIIYLMSAKQVELN